MWHLSPMHIRNLTFNSIFISAENQADFCANYLVYLRIMQLNSHKYIHTQISSLHINSNSFTHFKTSTSDNPITYFSQLYLL